MGRGWCRLAEQCSSHYFFFFPFDKTNDEQHALLTDRHGSALTCLGGKEGKRRILLPTTAWHGMDHVGIFLFTLDKKK